MNFYEDVIKKRPRFSSPLPCRDLGLLEPTTRAAVAALIAEAETTGIKLVVAETYRSAQHQQDLFASGRAKPGPILTKLDGKTPQTIGVHHFGLACDLARIEDGVADWKQADWYFLGPLAEKHGLTWGGTWGDKRPDAVHEKGFHDWDHVQLCTIAQQPALFAGTWYPEAKG